MQGFRLMSGCNPLGVEISVNSGAVFTGAGGPVTVKVWGAVVRPKVSTVTGPLTVPGGTVNATFDPLLEVVVTGAAPLNVTTTRSVR